MFAVNFSSIQPMCCSDFKYFAVQIDFVMQCQKYTYMIFLVMKQLVYDLRWLCTGLQIDVLTAILYAVLLMIGIDMAFVYIQFVLAAEGWWNTMWFIGFNDCQR